MEYKEISGIYNGGPALNKRLQNQLNQHPDKYEEGTDYYHLTGDLLRRFKLENPERAKSSHFIAWTRQGAISLCSDIGLDPTVITAAFDNVVLPSGSKYDDNIKQLVDQVATYVNSSQSFITQSQQVMDRSNQLMRQYLDIVKNTQESLIPQITELIRSLR